MKRQMSRDEIIEEHENNLFRVQYRGESILRKLEEVKENNPRQYFAICANTNISPEEDMIEKHKFLYENYFNSHRRKNVEKLEALAEKEYGENQVLKDNKIRVEARKYDQHANNHVKPKDMSKRDYHLNNIFLRLNEKIQKNNY